jgi:hypothetical protein
VNSPTPTKTFTLTPTRTVTPTRTPTVTPASGLAIHAGDLDGSISAGYLSRWNATVRVTVHDASEAPVAGATVSGNWSGGATGSGSCVTDSAGQCSITLSNIRGTVSSVTFSVSSLTYPAGTYHAAANHDPDGDSSGTAITIYRP